MQTEITHVFPTDATIRQAISVDNSPEATEAFAKLQAEVARVANTDTHCIVATWVKPQFSNGRSFPIRGAGALSFVIEGVRRGGCTTLQFFAVPKDPTPKGSSSYRDLFL